MIKSAKRAMEIFEDLLTQIDIRESQVEGGWDGDHKEDFDDMREFVEMSYPLYIKWLHETLEEEREKAAKKAYFDRCIPKCIVAKGRQYWTFYGSLAAAEEAAIAKMEELKDPDEANIFEIYSCQLYGTALDHEGRPATFKYITMYDGSLKRGLERFLHWDTFQRFFDLVAEWREQ